MAGGGKRMQLAAERFYLLRIEQPNSAHITLLVELAQLLFGQRWRGRELIARRLEKLADRPVDFR